jgi:hypothetical protein
MLFGCSGILSISDKFHEQKLLHKLMIQKLISPKHTIHVEYLQPPPLKESKPSNLAAAS